MRNVLNYAVATICVKHNVKDLLTSFKPIVCEIKIRFASVELKVCCPVEQSPVERRSLVYRALEKAASKETKNILKRT